MAEELRVCKSCGLTKAITEYMAFKERRKDGSLYVCFSRKCKTCSYKQYNSSPNCRKRRKAYVQKCASNPVFRPRLLVRRARKADRKKGHVCDLNAAFIEAALAKGCSYCGETNPMLLGLDRVDNMMGHVKTNVVACCTRCNMIRRDMPIGAFRFIVPQIRKAKELGLFGLWDGRIGNAL